MSSVISEKLSVDSKKDVDTVTCTCGHKIFDGVVIRSRCVKVFEGKALCRCKVWVTVPVCFLPY
ncbi:MAG: hypothetical protein ACR2PX_00925 [Endozoicomonas sp.]|uniref:hypothetical protein n=1 Tax=Endozoicomonas sp. TaxID=1892382 RepID=UPI003D9AFF8E